MSSCTACKFYFNSQIGSAQFDWSAYPNGIIRVRDASDLVRDLFKSIAQFLGSFGTEKEAFIGRKLRELFRRVISVCIRNKHAERAEALNRCGLFFELDGGGMQLGGPSRFV